MFAEIVPGLNPVVPKSNLLKQLTCVNVITDEPDVSVKLGALATVPAVLQQVIVLVIDASVTNPPVPVHVNPVPVAILRTVVAAVG
jgi:hypothetical protein